MLDDKSGFEPRKGMRRHAEERAAIVAETYVPGATVAGVAKQHGIVASKLAPHRDQSTANHLCRTSASG